MSGVRTNTVDGATFDLTVTVSSTRFAPTDPTLAVFDETGAATIMFRPLLATNLSVRAGDRLRVIGHIFIDERNGQPFPNCDRFEFLGHGIAPTPLDMTAEDLVSGRCDDRLVRLSGILRDIFTDEIDPIFTFLTVACGKRTVLVAIPSIDKSGAAALRQLIGGTITATGICTRSQLGGRHHIGRIICLSTIEDLQKRVPPSCDIFDAPELTQLIPLAPQDIVLRERHRCKGQVLAVWEGGRTLLRSHDGHVFRADFAASPIPSAGDFVMAVGFPESDMYCLGLTRAHWRAVRPWETAAIGVLPLTGDELNATLDGHPRYDPNLQGKTVRIEGLVAGISTDGRRAVRIYLQSGSRLTAVDVSHVENIPKDLSGCRIAVTGVCVLNIDRWHPNAAFPQIREIFIVARTPDDIRILKTPPWWTPARLAIVLSILFAALIGFALWNRLLKRAISAKSRELEREVIERIGSDFKVSERTRLAVELHDSLSQTLTGVAMHIGAACRALPPDGIKAKDHLELASRTLASCRGELKNCLWDLRNNALEDMDMCSAIRRIIAPHIGDAAIHIRFAAVRERFTDPTAHALLRIIRELATNAVRHGNASRIQIAGVIEEGILRISVRDDGRGFDISTAPGMEQGHFGLEGIRERLRAIGGTFDIDSSPGAGTRAVISIKLPSEGKVMS